MPWLVRYTSHRVDGGSPSSDLLEHHAALVSDLWDLGTSGVAELSASLVAGFDGLDTARTACGLAAQHGLMADIEPVDESWIRHEAVDVDLTTATGTDHFPVVAGAAFGHGGHPTTRLCLDLMSGLRSAAGADGSGTQSPRRVLDLGTGSGVLSIAAHRLGAIDIMASDVDPNAIESARFNTAANGVDVRLVHGDIDEVAAVADRAGAGFDLIVANVLLVVHEHVAASAGALLAPGGVLVVAGFLAHQADRVVAAYRAGRATIDVVDRMVIDEWCGLVLAEPPAAG
ncbi:MAG: 50S ribosomal protein L11 methyltransferase [Acidimicrobiia bacterium]|nr:50S ribosomal protein L11 methyltransferase [Acidimicrobiia bacterium]